MLFLLTIVTALIGFIWDVSLHIGNGRDEGPLANPAHYFILVGLFFLFTAGMTDRARRWTRSPPAAVRITRTWYAPVGGILLAATGPAALIGFPLDDLWHRLFGQDVTLWGPTHLMLIGGAGLSLVAVLLLEYEGSRNKPRPDEPDPTHVRVQRVFAFGGLLIGLFLSSRSNTTSASSSSPGAATVAHHRRRYRHPGRGADRPRTREHPRRGRVRGGRADWWPTSSPDRSSMPRATSSPCISGPRS